MRTRPFIYRSRNKRDTHITVIINTGTDGDMERIVNNIRLAVHKWNRKSKEKMSYEIYCSLDRHKDASKKDFKARKRLDENRFYLREKKHTYCE